MLKHGVPQAAYVWLQAAQAQTSRAVTACLDVVLQMTLPWNRRPGPACRAGASSKQTWPPSKLPTLLASWQTSCAGTPPRTGTLTPLTPRVALSRSVCHMRYADQKDVETHRLADTYCACVLHCLLAIVLPTTSMDAHNPCTAFPPPYARTTTVQVQFAETSISAFCSTFLSPEDFVDRSQLQLKSAGCAAVLAKVMPVLIL